MNSFKLFTSLGNIDERFIIEGDPSIKHRPKLFLIRTIATAACICLVTIITLAVLSKPNSLSPALQTNSSIQSTYSNISSTIKNNSSNENSALPKNEKKPSQNAESTRGGALKGSSAQRKTFIYNKLYIYAHILPTEYENFGIYSAISNDDIGEKIYQITGADTHISELIGCDVYSYIPQKDKFIIVKKADELMLFRLKGYANN